MLLRWVVGGFPYISARGGRVITYGNPFNARRNNWSYIRIMIQMDLIANYSNQNIPGTYCYGSTGAPRHVIMLMVDFQYGFSMPLKKHSCQINRQVFTSPFNTYL